MVKKTTVIAAEMANREAIRECLYRYCRGIDRLDVDLVLSAYWPDGTDDHTSFFARSPEELIEHAWPLLQSMDQTQHFLGNILIDIEGDVANVETYFQAFHRMRKPNAEPYDLVTSGRYIDRMECREDEWRIARRVVVRDWFREYADSADWRKGVWGAPQQPGLRSHSDRSYELLRHTT